MLNFLVNILVAVLVLEDYSSTLWLNYFFIVCELFFEVTEVFAKYKAEILGADASYPNRLIFTTFAPFLGSWGEVGIFQHISRMQLSNGSCSNRGIPY